MEVAEAQLAREIEDAFRTKVVMWGGALVTVAIAVSFGTFSWQRARSARQATESTARESELVGKVVHANREVGHARPQCEVQSVPTYDYKQTHCSADSGQNQLTALIDDYSSRSAAQVGLCLRLC